MAHPATAAMMMATAATATIRMLRWMLADRSCAMRRASLASASLSLTTIS